MEKEGRWWKFHTTSLLYGSALNALRRLSVIFPANSNVAAITQRRFPLSSGRNNLCRYRFISSFIAYLSLLSRRLITILEWSRSLDFNIMVLKKRPKSYLLLHLICLSNVLFLVYLSVIIFAGTTDNIKAEYDCYADIYTTMGLRQQLRQS